MKNIKRTLLALLAVPMLAVGALGVPAYAQSIECTIDGVTYKGAEAGAKCSKGDGQSETLFGDAGVFRTIVNVLLFLIGAVAVIMLIIGGIRYTLSGGDSAAVKAAKDTILYAVIGIIVALLSYAIVNWVLDSFLA